MTQQIESSGMPGKGGTSSGSSSIHGKASNKGLFGKILALVGQGSADNKPSQKQAALPSTDGQQSLVSSSKKTVHLSSQPASIGGAHKSRKSSDSDEQHTTLVAQAGVVAMATPAPDNIKRGNKAGHSPSTDKEPAHLAAAFTSITETPSDKKPSAHDGQHRGIAGQASGQHDSKQNAREQITQAGALARGDKDKPDTAKTLGNNANSNATVLQKTGKDTAAFHQHISAQQQAMAATSQTTEGSPSSDRTQLPHSGADMKAVDAHQATIGRNAGKGEATKEATVQNPLRSGTHADTSPSTGKKLQGVKPEPQQDSENKLSAERHDTDARQVARPNRSRMESPASQFVSANPGMVASNTLSNRKDQTSQHKSASVIGNTGAGKHSSTRGKHAYLDPNSTHKPQAHIAFAQQSNHPAQHAANPSAAPSLNGEALSQMGDKLTPGSASSVQSPSDSHAHQTLAGATIPTMVSQINTSSLPQAAPGTGPWSVASAMQEIGHAASEGRFRLELNLDPAHLGKIKVYLDSDASRQIQVHLVVDQSASRQVIEQQLPTLRQTLSQHGLDMGGFSMASQHDHQGGNGNSSSSRHEQRDYFAPAGNTPSAIPEVRTAVSNSRLSIRV